MTCKIQLCSIWEGFDGERFEVVDSRDKTVVLRSTSDGRRLEVPTWKFEAGMLREVKHGRRRLFVPSDIKLGHELWALDYGTAIRPSAKSKRKNRYLCRIYSDEGAGSVSYKHLSARQICARLNTKVDHVVDGDLRPGCELICGIRIDRRHGNFVRFSARAGDFVSNIEIFLKVVND